MLFFSNHCYQSGKQGVEILRAERSCHGNNHLAVVVAALVKQPDYKSRKRIQKADSPVKKTIREVICKYIITGKASVSKYADKSLVAIFKKVSKPSLCPAHALIKYSAEITWLFIKKFCSLTVSYFVALA